MEIKIWCLDEDSFLVYLDGAGLKKDGYHFTGEQLSEHFAKEFQREVIEGFRSSADSGSQATLVWYESHAQRKPKPHDGGA